MKRLLLSLPLVAAACLLAGPSTASAGSNYSFNWNSHSWSNNSWNWNSNNQGQSNLHNFLEDCDIDWNACDDNGYFSFKKDDCEVTQINYRDLNDYLCGDNKSWFGGFNSFKLYKKDWSKWWDFDCVEYVRCEPPTPPDCKVVPTPAAAGAGLGLIGLMAAGRRLRRTRDEA